MTDSYIKSINKRRAHKAALDYYFFGLGFGNILLAVCFLAWIANTNFCLDPLYITGMIVAGVIIASTFLAPELQKILMTLFRKFGTLIFTVILAAIYFLLFWPIGLIQKKRAAATETKPHSSFVAHKNSAMLSSSHKLIHTLHILRFFINERSAYIVPLLIVLILLGLLLAFAQTSIVAPLVYVFF